MLGVLVAAAAFGLTAPQHGTHDAQRALVAAHREPEVSEHMLPIIEKLKQMLARCEEVLHQDGSEDTMNFCRESKQTLEDMNALPESKEDVHAWALHESTMEVTYLCDEWVPGDKEKLTMHVENMKEVLRTYIERLTCMPGDVPCSEGGTVGGLKPACVCTCTVGYSGNACQVGPPKTTVLTTTGCDGNRNTVNIAVNIVHPSQVTLGTGKTITHQGPLDNLVMSLGNQPVCAVNVVSEGVLLGDWVGRRSGNFDVLDALRNARVQLTTCSGTTSSTGQVVYANANGGGWIPLDNQGTDRVRGHTDSYVIPHVGRLSSLVIQNRGSDAWEMCGVNVDGMVWTASPASPGKWLDDPCEFLQQRTAVAVYSGGGLDRTMATKGDTRRRRAPPPPPPYIPPPPVPKYGGHGCTQSIDVMSLVR